MRSSQARADNAETGMASQMRGCSNFFTRGNQVLKSWRKFDGLWLKFPLDHTNNAAFYPLSSQFVQAAVC